MGSCIRSRIGGIEENTIKGRMPGSFRLLAFIMKKFIQKVSFLFPLLCVYYMRKK